MTKMFEITLADRRGQSQRHLIIKADSMAEAVVEAEMTDNKLMVNKCVELFEALYNVEMIYGGGTTRINNTIRAFSEADAAAIARRRNPSHTVIAVSELL